MNKQRGVTSITNLVGLVVLAGVLAIGGYTYWVFSRPKVDTTVAVIAKPAPVIAKVKKRVIKPRRVIVYVPEAKAKLKLPPLVIANENQQVTGATTVKPSERSVTVTSVLDTQTGETTTYAKPEPLPWFAVEARGEARVDVGYKWVRGVPSPVQVGRLSVRHDFVQVKGFHAGVNAAIDTDASLFVGLGVGYRW